MAKTTRKAGKGAAATGRVRSRARKSSAPKPSRPGKPAKSAPSNPKPSAASEIARLKSRLKTARVQQHASAEVLRAVSNATGDLERSLYEIAEITKQLFEASSVSIFVAGGNEWGQIIHAGASSRRIGAEVPASQLRIGSHSLPGAVFSENRQIHLPDIFDVDSAIADWPGLPSARAAGSRTICGTPTRRASQPIGVLAVHRDWLAPFTDEELALLQAFADQAAIAIENARLFNETKQALERQTAAADVLKIISRSVSQAAPVFDTILESCQRLFDPYDAAVYLVDGGMVRGVARRGSGTGEWGTDSMPLEGSSTGLAIAQRQALHFPDLADKADFPEDMRAAVKEAGGISVLYAPMISEARGVGSLVVTRRPKKPFTEIEIEFIQSFADQAVIAIENSRLFEQVQTRTRELEQSLLDLRKAQDRLVQTEKLASLGQLTAGIAHEIKNPLNFVNNFSALSVELTDELNEVLQEAVLADKIRSEVDELTGLLKDNLGKVVQHGKRADSIVKNMLLHSRQGSGEYRPADVNALVDESLLLAYHGALTEDPKFNVSLQRDFDPEAGVIEVFPQEITRVLLNLISNGFYAINKRKSNTDDGKFEPVVSVVTRSYGDHVEIRIRDNGTGIPSEAREQIFNPFFTTKPAGEGTGLGLSMSHDIIVKQHGGRIDVETEPDVYTEFIVTLRRRSGAQGTSGGTN